MEEFLSWLEGESTKFLAPREESRGLKNLGVKFELTGYEYEGHTRVGYG